jgi:RHS repeat-associated protein
VAFDDVSLIQVGASTNLVVNPSFETQSSSDYTLPANWTVVSQAQGTYPATSNWRGSWGGSGPRSGTFAYSSGNLAYGYLRSSEIVAQPGASYNLSVYVKLYRDTTASNGTPTVRGVALDSSGTALAYFPVADTGITNSSTYKKYGGNFTTPANTAKVRVELLSVMAAGWVAFDDVSLTPVPVTVIYYYAGGQRIAQRTRIGTAPDRLEYLFGDHLGSSSLVTNSSFVKTAELRYTAWGKPRSTTGTVAANAFTYTGQRQEAGIGLNFYKARWYDSNIGHFAQADTIVPDLAKPQSWDRYAYTSGNPVNRVDPDGHEDTDDCRNCGGGGAGGSIGSVENRILKADQRTVAKELEEWYADPEHKVYYYRSMGLDDDGLPIGGASKTKLGATVSGARPDIVPDEAGFVSSNPTDPKGMSTALDPKLLPKFLRPPELGGTSRNPLWRIDASKLPANLEAMPDLADPNHILIAPASKMTIEAYQQALLATRSMWTIVIIK